MDEAAPAVFKMHDSMCEVATHSAWAKGVVERARVFGVQQEEGCAAAEYSGLEQRCAPLPLPGPSRPGPVG